MEIKSHTDYMCGYVKEKTLRHFKIRIIHLCNDRMSVLFLESTPKGIWTGYYKWWFIDEFLKVYELFDLQIGDDQTPVEIIDTLFIDGERQFRENYFKYLSSDC